MPPSRLRSVTTLLGNEINTFTGSDVATPKYAETYFEDRIFWYGSEGHYGYPDFPTERNVGGPFRLNGRITNRSIIPVGEIWRGGANDQRYIGSLSPSITTTNAWGDFPPDAWGAEAYAKMKPTKPSFSGLNSLYELRELAQTLEGRARNLREISSYWVGLQFGWKPLLSDILGLVNHQRKTEARLKQLLRDNGRPVRRRITLVETNDTVSTDFTSYSAFNPVLVTQFYRKQPTVRQIRSSTDKVWASARFRYWLPGGPQDIKWKRKMLARIYGLYPSPSVIYNAIPWSWLVDWFSNVGDIVENLEVGVADRLAADYFYVMREKSWFVTNTATGYFTRRNGEPCQFTGSSTFHANSKYRAKGDPFGFATSQNDLSLMQLSILGALGISKIR
jgi:hypothetical protein